MKRFLSFLLFLFLLGIAQPVFAQPAEEILQGRMDELQVLSEDLTGMEAQLQVVGEGDPTAIKLPDVSSEEAKVEITEIIETGETNGDVYTIFRVKDNEESYVLDTRDFLLPNTSYRFGEGEKIWIQKIYADGELTAVFMTDFVRTNNLFLIIALFALVSILVGGWRGMASLAGIGITLVVLFGMIFPWILAGRDPVLITIFGGVLILAVNMHLSHGFSKSTLFAFLSTVAGLLLAWIFGEAFIYLAQLSGMVSEEATLLQVELESIGNGQSILLAGFLLGAVGVLDDIAITQAEAVEEIEKANPSLKKKELFQRAMRLGRHHIASTVNTLVLAYAGVALPLFLLALANPEITGMYFLNEELVAEEIVRTLSATIALVLTVPIATWFATLAKKR